MLNTKSTMRSSAVVSVTGVTGQLQEQVFIQPPGCQLGDQKLTVFSICQTAPFHCWVKIYSVNCMHK